MPQKEPQSGQPRLRARTVNPRRTSYPNLQAPINSTPTRRFDGEDYRADYPAWDWPDSTDGERYTLAEEFPDFEARERGHA